ncbi:mechanosensitive ion channel domain-containing protein [Argonema galeatum]|uniref:mechanosensitive ion channel domain-containing protein n=1 Tax=Argonema galeatum TaxID=2942762 RepID=UPI002011F7AB|nr:mechanosensitive ion channel domain-containing protein [Argonema galeatum]MCL1465835.1 mechanosensitive ion channel [Argonema galeatum A003/A1]
MERIIDTILIQIARLFTASLFKIGDYPVSISSIGELIISLLIAIYISNALSNFLKERLLVRIGIDEGNREAIAVIVRYVTAALGIIIVLQSVGFNLGSLAILAGGLGVGIGFGVQDLTTNFVSGLTLLVDRPVKVGDYIELENLMGTVKKISIRSTIIKTNDNSSVIVPNSTMIGNKIVNWSYDSSNFCLRIPVSVAEHNDPLLVTEALITSAYMESAVLYNPNPRVLFLGFGEEGLKFELLAWIEQPNQREFIKSSLYFAIEYNFRKQGINFPAEERHLWLQNPEVLAGLFQKAEPTDDIDKDGTQATDREPTLQLVPKKQLSLSDLMRQIVYFKNLNDIELRKLIEAGYRQRLVASQILFRENDPGDAFYIILSGSVEVFVEKINKHLTNLVAGQFFGELALMLGIPRTATVRALEETFLFAINKTGFQKLLKEHPEFYEQIVKELGKHQEELTARQKQLREMGLVDATEDDQNPVVWVRKRLINLFNL